MHLFMYVRSLGSGTFAVTVLCTHKNTGAYVCAKIPLPKIQFNHTTAKRQTVSEWEFLVLKAIREGGATTNASYPGMVGIVDVGNHIGSIKVTSTHDGPATEELVEHIILMRCVGYVLLLVFSVQ
jgi:hypothetical protein